MIVRCRPALDLGSPDRLEVSPHGPDRTPGSARATADRGGGRLVRVPRDDARASRPSGTSRSSRGPGPAWRSVSAPSAPAGPSSGPPSKQPEKPLIPWGKAYAKAFPNQQRRAPVLREAARALLTGEIVCHCRFSDARSRRIRRRSRAPRNVPKLNTANRRDARRTGEHRRTIEHHPTEEAPPRHAWRAQPQEEHGRRRRRDRGSRSRLRHDRPPSRRPSRGRRSARRARPPDPPAHAAEAGAAAEGEARAARLRRRGREARRRARGRPGRRGLPRAARAPVDRRQHLPRRRRQRPAGHGGRVRRDRPREERLPLRRRDRRPRARRPQGRPQDPGPDPARRERPRPGRQGPDEDEGRAAHDRDLAARPLRRLRPARRRARRLAPARRRRAQPAEGDPQGARAQAGRRDRPHRRRGRVGRGHRARPRLPAAPLALDRGEGQGVEGAVARLPGGRAAAARRARPLHRRLRAAARRPRPHPQADRRLPEEDLAAHGRAGHALQGARAADGGLGRRAGDPLDAQPARRPALRRLPDLRLRRGVHGHRRQHRPLRRLALEEVGRAARGHDHEEQPRGGQGGRPPAAAARHRRHHRHRLHRHGEPEEPRRGRAGARRGARARPHEDLRRRDLAARASSR